MLQRIREKVGDSAVTVNPDKLQEYSRDAGTCAALPEVVVEPVESDQVQALMRLAREHRFAVTPRGQGTGLTGAAVPVAGGVLLSLLRMNRILSVDERNLLAIVEPGVINVDLKRAAREKGLFYPPDPASHDTSTLGGNAATNAGGPSCIKYGTTRDYVLGLEVVLANGEKIQTGVQTRKGVVGYDLTHLMVGSEGTLGIITRLMMKLLPHPPALSTLVSVFPDLSSAMRAVTAILNGGYIPCALEFMDRHCMELVGDLLPFGNGKGVGAFLMVEADGHPDVLNGEMEGMGMLCLDYGAMDVFMAPDSAKRAQMWGVRKEVSLRIESSFPLYIAEDVVVPIAAIAQFVEGLPELERRFGFKIFSFGHAGDGNIHLNITREVKGSEESVEEGLRVILQRVLSMGGTISGEHGIGLEKKRFLGMELSSESIRLQKAVKDVFDPMHLLNPGKIFP